MAIPLVWASVVPCSLTVYLKQIIPTPVGSKSTRNILEIDEKSYQPPINNLRIAITCGILLEKFNGCGI